MLSLGSTSIWSFSGPGVPSIFILNEDWLPPISLTEESSIFSLFSLKTFIDWVTEPVEVKTVSKKTVSEENLTRASGLVIKESFLQETESRQITRATSRKDLYITLKNSN